MVYTQKYSEITSDDEDELKKVISSFKIKNLNNSNASSISYAVPLLMILIFGTIICLWNVSKQKKNKNKNVKTKKLKS